MEQDRQEVAEQVGVEVSVEVAAVVAGWEVTVPAPDPAENVSALIAGHACHIKWAVPVIIGVVLSAGPK